jgi:uncharacterized repeat protein (TIGR01451 family)
MKNIYFTLILFLILLAHGKNDAQTFLVCNDLTYVSLDQDCMHTVLPEEVLESPLGNLTYLVELDKTPPLGNGPFVPAVAGIADIGKTYQVRVTEPISGNKCWGSIKFEETLGPVMDCDGVTTVNLVNGISAPVTVNDLNVTIVDGCSAPANVITFFGLGQTSEIFNCSDVGVSILTLQASDQYGNTSSCMTTVVVNDDGTCSTCVTYCPPAATVTFSEGYNTLYAGLQSGNLGAFDPFGNPIFNPGCNFQDSVYSIEYHAGTAGQSWFIRQWEWKNASGQVVDFCQQPILFPTNRTINLHGTVFLDLTPNCTIDAGDSGTDLFSLTATTLPSGSVQIIQPAADGSYVQVFNLSAQDSAVVVHLNLPTGISSVCPSAIIIPYGTPDQDQTFDIGLRSTGDCPMMQVDISAYIARRCRSNPYVIQYCNLGLDTAYNAQLEIHLDSLMTLDTADLPFVVDTNGTYTIQLGDVPPLTCGNVHAEITIDCDAALGQTLCVEVIATPSTPCGGVWDGPEIVATAHCEGDSVRLALWNNGIGDMSEDANFIVIEDFIMYKNDVFQLNAGDSITIMALANGSTWRIEGGQAPNFPIRGVAAAAVEGCGGLNTPGLINAYAQSDNAPAHDIECLPVQASCDPNDKTVVPSGIGPNHIISANGVMEYKIRFQNTGNDTAFRVVIVDTLSTQLDPYTLETGAASHPYHVETYKDGIIHFVFDPIALPDSNQNVDASQGFVQFRVSQKADLPVGTVIENKAAIYFDSNTAVITNTVHEVIGQPYLLVSSQTPLLPGVSVKVMPNPFNDQAVLEVQGKTLKDGLLTLYDVQGRVVRQQPMQDNKTLLLRNGLNAGLYFFQVSEDGTIIATGKLEAH